MPIYRSGAVFPVFEELAVEANRYSPRKKERPKKDAVDDSNLGFRKFIRKIEGKDLTVTTNSG